MKCLFVFSVLSLALSLGGCQHERTATVLQGHTAFEILEPAARPLPPGAHAEIARTESDVEYISGYFAEKDLAKPVYPTDALAANTGTRFVTVTVSFDENGKVTDAVPSLRGFSTADKYAEDFLSAVKAAVLLWKITPPHNVHYRRGPDGQRMYVRTEALASSMDIKFTFEPSGQVKSEAPRSDGIK
jgi:hypothetical protein